MAALGIRHLGLKLTSVALAVLLWLLVSGDPTVERAMRVPLELTNLPTELELIGEPPSLVDVRIRGSAGALSRIGSGDLAAVLDVRTARPGQRLFHLGAEDVRAPFGVEVVQVLPASIEVSFGESTTKKVPVVAPIDGEPAPGFIVSGVDVQPPEVEVVGPSGLLAALTQARTEPVSVAGASDTVIDTVTVGVTDTAVRLPQTQSVRVTVTITAVPVEWSVTGIPLRVSNAGPNLVLSNRAIDVRVRGARDAMSLPATEFSASIDVGGLTPGRHVVPVRVEAPSGVGVIRVDPAEVGVTIR
jgi:YbbR domain-containing protein